MVLGDRDTRRLDVACVLLPLGLSALAGIRSWPMLLGLLALPPAVAVTRRGLGGADGRRLVRVLGETGLLLLAWSVATAVGLALGPVAERAFRYSGRVPACPGGSECPLKARGVVVAPQPRPQRLPLLRRGGRGDAASAVSSRARSPRNSSIDSGSATISATSRAMTNGVPARSSSPAITASRASRASV